MRNLSLIAPFLFRSFRGFDRSFRVIVLASLTFGLPGRAVTNSSVKFVSLSRVMGSDASKMAESGDVLKVKPKPQVKFSDEELKERLTSEQYSVTQTGATERAWTGEYVKVDETGSFKCVVCGSQLFQSEHKFESGSGWPSFSDVAAKGTVAKVLDESMGISRVEVVCVKCGAHLGHVFTDGPGPSGLRYCINSASLKFDSEKDTSKN